MTRTDYLDNLSEDYGIERATVYLLADILGEDEDQDGLICELEDLSLYGDYE